VSVRPTTMTTAYHRRNSGSGDIAIPHDGEFRLGHNRAFPQGRLAMEEVGDAFGTEATEGPPGSQVPAVTTTDLPDGSSPSAAMAYPRALVGKTVADSHFSLSPLERGRWEIAR
jgi:hypothetical protein